MPEASVKVLLQILGHHGHAEQHTMISYTQRELWDVCPKDYMASELLTKLIASSMQVPALHVCKTLML